MRHTAALLSALLVVAACGYEPTATPSAAPRVAPAATAERGLGPAVERDLATLRRVTAPFHDFEVAKHAGWSTQITPCMVDPAQGGMGFHFGNTNLIDGSVRVDEPELLLYEPEKNGRMRLVAVEYIVPFTQWTATQPPRLFDRDFRRNEQFQVWALHAWVWEHNPDGVFADWNPRVSCDYASQTMTM